MSTGHVFISHAWKYSSDYYTIITWLSESGMTVKNYSVPQHDPFTMRTPHSLKIALTEQIKHANIVIIIGGMYAAYSDWIQYEIDKALQMRKKIILIKPRGNERLPVTAQAAATLTVNWNRNSLITAIRQLL